MNAPPELRAYQTAAVDSVRDAIRSGKKRILLTLPTGAGKTNVSSHIIRQCVAKRNQALFLCHRKELVEQCVERLAQYGVTAGIIRTTDKRTNPDAPVQVASIATLVKRISRSLTCQFALIVVDEAHHTTASTYTTILSRLPRAIVLGLTATPCRGDGRGLGDLFDELIVGARASELIEAGYLVPVRMFSGQKIDLKGVKKTGGDYNLKTLAERMDTVQLVGDLVGEWQRLASDRKTVVFAVDIQHSKDIAERFRQAGIAAAHLDGTFSDEAREQVLADLREGRVQVIVNCQVLGEGWDSPSVDCIVLARPTKSLPLYLQMAGRAMRPYAGKKDCLILDHAGAFKEHGAVVEDRVWRLAADFKVEPTKDHKECEQCGAVIPIRASACPECAEVFSTPERVIVEVADQKLVEVGPAKDPRWQAFLRWTMKGLAEDFKPGFAAAKFKEKYGEWPPKTWRRKACAELGIEAEKINWTRRWDPVNQCWKYQKEEVA